MMTGFVEAMIWIYYGPLMDLSAVAVSLSTFVAVCIPLWTTGRVIRRFF